MGCLAKPSPFAAQNDGTAFKAALLSGPPGMFWLVGFGRVESGSKSTVEFVVFFWKSV